MLSKIFLPYFIASTIVEKLSSAKLSMEEGLITAEEYDEYKERLLGRK